MYKLTEEEKKWNRESWERQTKGMSVGDIKRLILILKELAGAQEMNQPSGYNGQPLHFYGYSLN